MKLKAALEMAAVCGLDNMCDAIYNVERHAGSFFAYTEINDELKELYDEALAICPNPKEWKNYPISQDIIDEENRKMNEYFAAQEFSNKEFDVFK